MAYTTIDKPTDYFNTKTWSGASGDLNITNLDFQPDWVWIKSRNTTGADHKLVDAVRGNSKSLKSNATEAESTDAEGIQSFNSDGYTLGDDDGNYNRVGRTYVGWNWLADNTSGSSNTDGSLSSTVSANQTSGFSIVEATGTSSGATTIGHGLGVAPRVIIKKQTSQTSNWAVYHASVGASQVAELNLTNAFSGSGQWGSTAPTSTVFTNYANSGVTAIYYCFAEKKGYSKFGIYTGNGNADGTFVYTGFKPAWLLYKRTDVANSWIVFDNKRDPSNSVDAFLSPNSDNAENVVGSAVVDFLSNGFKIREATNRSNASGGSYIYMAFSENPFVTSTGIPTTAR